MSKIDILIVDDEEYFCKILKKTIENNLELKVLYINKIIDAINYLVNNSPKIIIVDIYFNNDPILNNGFKLIEKHRNNNYIILSSQTNSITRKKAEKFKIKYFIEKSTDSFKEILKILKDEIKSGGKNV